MKYFLHHVVAISLLIVSSGAQAIFCEDFSGASLYSDESEPVFLGYFGGSVPHGSIYNSSGPYGSSASSTSVFDSTGTYGSSFSNVSAFDDTASRPPIIVKNGYFLGRLTTNTSVSVAWAPDNLLPCGPFAGVSSPAPISVLLEPDLFNDFINETYNGSWWNPGRNGEGFVFDITQSQDGQVIVVYWYTYLNGNQVWLVGNAVISDNAQSVVIQMQMPDGADFGDDFDSDDVVRNSWGAIRVSFSSCESGLVEFNPAIPGFESGSVEIERLTPLPRSQRCD